jgi:glycosyltransferase involved in cell wall biosynthesis
LSLFPSPEAIGTDFQWAVGSGLSARVWPTMELPVAGDLRVLFSGVPRLRPLPRSLRQVVFAWMELVGLRRALARTEPDVVHDHLGMRRFMGMVNALGVRTPVVLTHPEGSIEANLDGYAAVIFPSRMALARSAPSATRARIFPPPVSPAFLASLSASVPVANTLVFVGGRYAKDSLMTLLAALRGDAQLRTTCQLTVCGEIAADEDLRSTIDGERLPVTFSGVVSAAQLREVFDQNSLLVLPGRPRAASHAAREAACRGMATLTWSAQAEDLNEILGTPAAIGLVGEDMEPQKLARRILSALESEKILPSYRAELALRARVTFSATRYAEQHLQLYAEVG